MSFEGFSIRDSVSGVSLESLPEVVERWKDYLTFGATVGLSGPLGGGKTTFVRALTDVLEVQEPVTSPTYVLQHIYESSGGVIEHWDLYRISSAPTELFEEADKPALILIEWPEKDPQVFPLLTTIIRFSVESEELRTLELFVRD